MEGKLYLVKATQEDANSISTFPLLITESEREAVSYAREVSKLNSPGYTVVNVMVAGLIPGRKYTYDDFQYESKKTPSDRNIIFFLNRNEDGNFTELVNTYNL